MQAQWIRHDWERPRIPSRHSWDFKEPISLPLQCGPWSSSIVIIWELLEMQISGLVPVLNKELCGGPGKLGMLKLEKQESWRFPIYPWPTGVWLNRPAWEVRSSTLPQWLFSAVSFGADSFLYDSQKPVVFSLRKSWEQVKSIKLTLTRNKGARGRKGIWRP